MVDNSCRMALGLVPLMALDLSFVGVGAVATDASQAANSLG
jgi:hypothetical protein